MEYAAVSSVNPPSAEGVGFYRSFKSRVADNAEEEERDRRARHCVAPLYYSFYFKLGKYNGAQRSGRNVHTFQLKKP